MKKVRAEKNAGLDADAIKQRRAAEAEKKR